MDLKDLLLRVSDHAARQRIPFMLIGGMAVSTWAEPRLTHDVDIVVNARRKDAPRLKRALVDCGARVTALEMRLMFEKRFVRLRTQGPQLDVHVATTSLDREAFKNASPVSIEGRSIPVASPEDLILYKLAAWRLQDQTDIEKLLGSRRKLSLAYIDQRVDRLERETGAPMRSRWEIAKSRPKT